MAYTIKCYCLIVIFIVLAVDFGEHEKTKLVDGRVSVKVAEKADVDREQSAEAQEGDKSEEPDYADRPGPEDKPDDDEKHEKPEKPNEDALVPGFHQRRHAPKYKAVQKSSDHGTVHHDEELGLEQRSYSKAKASLAFDHDRPAEGHAEELIQQQRRSAYKPKNSDKWTDHDRYVPHDDDIALHQRRSAPEPRHVEKPTDHATVTDQNEVHETEKSKAIEKSPENGTSAHHDEEIQKPGLSHGRQSPIHPVDENGKYVGPFDPDCSDTIVITPVKKEVDLEFEHTLLKPGSITCHWTVIGTEDCVPVVNCKRFHLIDGNGDKEDPCAEEFLEITDGSYGYQRFCGKEGPEDVTSGRKFRDFYITLRLAAIKTDRQFRCTVSCSPGKVRGKPIEENTEPEVDETCNCGLRPPAEKIVGGEDSRHGEFPWMAALVAAGTRKPFCGASIINNRMILTAAHCFKGPYMQAKNINILIHAQKLNNTDPKVEVGKGGGKALLTVEQLLGQDKKDQSYRYTVDKYFIHPLYVRQTNDFDVALIKLDKPIDFKTIKTVLPSCIPQPNHYGESKEGTQAVIAGWGVDHNGASNAQPVLQKLDVGVLSDDECKEIYGDRYTRRMVCAGYREHAKDSCKGDPGGPLVTEKSKLIWEQIGIVSYGEGCVDKHHPSVYINTRQVSQWIRYISNMEESVWCHGN